MDLPCLPWQDHVAQKWIGLDPELKERFITMEEIDDIFKCALSLTTQTDVDFMQSISAASSVQKDSDRAAECRENGNLSFKRRDYPAAALHYSQGICLAPQSSEQLSLCYANRSASLYHLQLYQDCLHDIHGALRSGYPSHLMHKLEERRSACLKRLPAGEEAGEEEECRPGPRSEGPDTEPSVHICPRAAVSSSVEKGRHLVAVGRISAGEVILRERPFSCVLLPGLQEVKGGGAGRGAFGTESRRCHRCLAETLRPVPCGGCSYSRYCSPGCRTDAWEEHHRWECPLGAHLTAAGAMLQLALRVALKAGVAAVEEARGHSEPGPNCPSSPQPSSYLSVFNLLHHVKRHSPALRFLCAVSVATLYLSSELWLLGSTVLRHMLQLRCNAQAVVALQETGAVNSSVRSSREVRLASAMFPTLSLLNHSCRPNTSLAFDPGTRAGAIDSETSADRPASGAGDRGLARGVAVTVRAAQVISPEQEILHCYGPHSSRMVTRERRRLLHEQYFFLCQCEACSPEEEEEYQPGACEALKLLETTRTRSGLILTETHPLRGELADATARAFATMGDWKNAASHLERSVAAVGSQYGEDSIELAQQLFKLAQLHFNRGPALSVIPKVRRLLRLHRGPRCPELQELEDMEDCLRG
uniref:Protein-lysine N-methyltransferase SMYD4 n=1 Tax=Salarias fasciatus TaxID=181472 RepID=A0A672FNN9_SALFA